MIPSPRIRPLLGRVPSAARAFTIALLFLPCAQADEAECFGAGWAGQYMGSHLNGNLVWPTPLGSETIAVGAGLQHNFRIDGYGVLFGAGDNSIGQLGNGTTSSARHSWVAIEPDREFSQVAAGDFHSLFLDERGHLRVAGDNSSGQLGDGTFTSRSSMVYITYGVKAIAAGGAHSAFIRDDGSLVTFGSNSDGQLGNGSYTNSATLQQVASDVISVACGDSHTLFVTRNGDLWGMGKNDDGQIDGTSSADQTRPVRIMGGVLAADGGRDFSIVVTRDLGLYAFGANDHGQLGTGDTTPREAPTLVATDVIAAAAGDFHAVFLKRDRSLWTMGEGSNGQLADGRGQDSMVPVRVLDRVASVTAGPYTTWFTDAVEKPGWGLLTLLRSFPTSQLFDSDAFGVVQIARAGDGAPPFGHSLMCWLECDGTTVRSESYGTLTPTGYPGWVDTGYFGRMHFAAGAQTYDEWVNTVRFDWMKFVPSAGAMGTVDFYLWVHRLQTWIAVQEGGNFFSFDMGALTPVAGSPTRYNTPIGPITVDGDNPLGWVRSDRFGYVWWARDGNRTWFWSDARNEWLGLTPGGGIWSTAEERFI